MELPQNFVGANLVFALPSYRINRDSAIYPTAVVNRYVGRSENDSRRRCFQRNSGETVGKSKSQEVKKLRLLGFS
jgi:hypothetical protein